MWRGAHYHRAGAPAPAARSTQLPWLCHHRRMGAGEAPPRGHQGEGGGAADGARSLRPISFKQVRRCVFPIIDYHDTVWSRRRRHDHLQVVGMFLELAELGFRTSIGCSWLLLIPIYKVGMNYGWTSVLYL
jgi:hypothetical protein